MKRSIIITVFCACVAFLFWQCNKESVVEKVEYQRGNIVHYGSGASFLYHRRNRGLLF